MFLKPSLTPAGVLQSASCLLQQHCDVFTCCGLTLAAESSAALAAAPSSCSSGAVGTDTGSRGERALPAWPRDAVFTWALDRVEPGRQRRKEGNYYTGRWRRTFLLSFFKDKSAAVNTVRGNLKVSHLRQRQAENDAFINRLLILFFIGFKYRWFFFFSSSDFWYSE